MVITSTVNKQRITPVNYFINSVFEKSHLGAYREPAVFGNFFGAIKNYIDFVEDTWVIFIQDPYLGEIYE